MWQLVFVAAGLWILQGILGFYQMRHFNQQFKLLRQQGRVAVGRAKGRFAAGVVVLFCLDRAGTIIKAEKMSGVSSFARLRPFTLFDGCELPALRERLGQVDKQTGKAVLNAVENYQAFIEANRQEVREVKPAESEQVTA